MVGAGCLRSISPGLPSQCATHRQRCRPTSWSRPFRGARMNCTRSSASSRGSFTTCVLLRTCKKYNYTPRAFIAMRSNLGTLAAIEKLVLSGDIQSGRAAGASIGPRGPTRRPADRARPPMRMGLDLRRVLRLPRPPVRLSARTTCVDPAIGSDAWAALARAGSGIAKLSKGPPRSASARRRLLRWGFVR